MQTLPTLSPPVDQAGDIPSEAWDRVQDAHDLCDVLEGQGRGVRFRRDSPHPWAELTSADGSMTLLLRGSDLVDPGRLQHLIDAS